ncbi:hypothetical protein LMG28688_02810 [Paraburkholderia caffeinitolerans]|uniref:Uncharacterized protein n=1 Tax=Paraburkholderia caffeinitolerans TaxID=1723730 RepID=A0A6J5FY89_9BURK|nr:MULTISPECIES: hypothetical protein [Paraburkholderia]CAB3789043.1 hypothetical protein LMG28688_02810 [Paraburkholderia caffeinitolerans]
MKDAYGRRALLLQLGDVLKMLDYIKAHSHDAQTVGDLIRHHEALAGIALLDSVAQTMTVSELEYRALHAFCRWPQLLLDEPLDHGALATPVREGLFDDNPYGWESWTESLANVVPWLATAAAVPV